MAKKTETTTDPEIKKGKPEAAVEPEIKKAVVDEELVKQFSKVRVPGLKGGYRSLFFSDDGVAENVSSEELEVLKKDFPETIEVVEE